MTIHHSNGYHPVDPDEDELERLASPAPAGESVEGLIELDEPEEAARTRELLTPVRQSMESAGFYAYLTFDQQQRLAVASDDEMGRFDIWVEGDALVVSLWASSPGIYMDEENQWKRKAMERLARMTVPRISQGMLADNQEALWEEEDHGVAVRITYRLPLDQADTIGAFVRQHIPELDELLEFVERQLG